jgi:hypothetical protein
MKIKMAIFRTRALIRSFADGSILPCVGKLSAISIGHMIFEGVSAWPEVDARRSLFEANSTLDKPRFGVTSIRLSAESAIAETLGSRASQVSEFLHSSLDSPKIADLESFLETTLEITRHLHPAKSCVKMPASTTGGYN